MKLIFLLLIFLIPFSLSTCVETQVDINSASLAKLDLLDGIGPAYAQGIIDSRPYATIDELEKVKGIGPKTLEKIKSQGLACVGDSSVENNADLPAESSEKIQEIPQESLVIPNIEESSTESIINLNSEQQLVDNSNNDYKIVYESKNEKVKKNLLYAFSIFLTLTIIILLIKR